MAGRTVTGEPAVASLSSPISAESAAEGGGGRISGLPDGGRSGPVVSEIMHSGWADELQSSNLGAGRLPSVGGATVDVTRAVNSSEHDRSDTPTVSRAVGGRDADSRYTTYRLSRSETLKICYI